jgi:hypothetical protein
MNGDIYEVHYNKFGDSETHESELGRFDTWKEAKAERNRIFITFANSVRAAWVMRTNPGLNLQQHRAGNTMRRVKPQSENK